MKENTLNDIVTKHKKWLLNENGGEKANLGGAYLVGADLRSANLRGADLRSANLRSANLVGADLCSTAGDSSRILSVQTKKYHINYYDDRMQIGCKNYSVKEWLSFEDDVIDSMDRDALTWWKVWKSKLIALWDL